MRLVVVDTTKVRIFKQITTFQSRKCRKRRLLLIPQRYEFSSKSQQYNDTCHELFVVVDTTKVRIFKQITTQPRYERVGYMLLLIPQRYEFSSKSQQIQQNIRQSEVVVDTTKVRIFKQITTNDDIKAAIVGLLLIPQRYEFSSKSQHNSGRIFLSTCCCWYHKGTNFQANHNVVVLVVVLISVVVDTTKVRIFKQITT